MRKERRTFLFVSFHLLPPSAAYMVLIAQTVAQGHFVFGETTEIPAARTQLLLVFALPTDNGGGLGKQTVGVFCQIVNCLKSP